MILKPILVVVTLVLYANGKYKDGNFSPKQSYLYLTIIYMISYTMALYVLALFYVACKDLLQPFNPVPKFIIIKSVVFLTYWQVILHLIHIYGYYFLLILTVSCCWLYGNIGKTEKRVSFFGYIMKSRICISVFL